MKSNISQCITLKTVTITPPDLHVVSLQYALRPSDGVSYANPPPLEFETEEARFRMAAGKLTCEMKTHFPTAEAARAVVEPILRAWEVDAGLRGNRGELRFKFDGADIVDRSPVPPGVIRGAVSLVLPAVSFSGTGTVSVHITRNQYPDPPPSSFRLNPDAQSILDRYNRYLDGGETLLAMAYFCLTVLEVNAGSKQRTSIATRCRIHKDVLSTMGRLTSEHGDRLNARKASAAHPLTGSESGWLEAAVKKLIWQLGTPEAERSWITMSDLPAL